MNKKGMSTLIGLLLICGLIVGGFYWLGSKDADTTIVSSNIPDTEVTIENLSGSLSAKETTLGSNKYIIKIDDTDLSGNFTNVTFDMVFQAFSGEVTSSGTYEDNLIEFKVMIDEFENAQDSTDAGKYRPVEYTSKTLKYDVTIDGIENAMTNRVQGVYAIGKTDTIPVVIPVAGSDILDKSLEDEDDSFSIAKVVAYTKGVEIGRVDLVYEE